MLYPKSGLNPAEVNRKRRNSLWRSPTSLCVSCWKLASLRPPDPPLEPQDGAVHLRRPQQHPHRRSAQTVPLLHQALVRSADIVAGAAACCSSAPSGRPPERSPTRQALRPVLHQSPLARRHADQLEDHLPVDRRLQASWRECSPARRTAAPRRRSCTLTRERDKLNQALGGIKDMGGLPDLLFVIDTNKEHRHPGGAQARASRSSPWSTPTAIPTASTSRSPATTTPAAPSRSIAISSRAPPSTASSAARRAGVDVGASETPPGERRPRRGRGGRRGADKRLPSDAQRSTAASSIWQGRRRGGDGKAPSQGRIPRVDQAKKLVEARPTRGCRGDDRQPTRLEARRAMA